VERDEMPLQLQVLVEPFEKWTLYFVGPIASISRKKMDIFVCMDLVTKWVEDKSFPRDNE
jgi:hypothetical protein